MSCCPTRVPSQEVLALLFLIAPQFSTDDQEKIDSYLLLIDSLRCMINESALGCCAALAFANLLAHYLTVQANSMTGIATGLHEGQLSISLGTTIGGVPWQSTAYGQAYWQYVSTYKLGAYITNSRRIWVGPACCGGYGY